MGGEVVGEAYGEVKEERGLECLRGHVAPEDEPVERAGLACGAEAVQDEGHQAKDIKVDGLGRGPTPEEDVDSYTEVDERDEPETLINRAIFGFEDDLDIEAGCTLKVSRMRNGTKNGVGGVCPDSTAVHLANKRCETGG